MPDDIVASTKPAKYRDTETLRLAGEINDFVRSKTDNPTVADVSLEAARATCSFVVWPPSESPQHRRKDDLVPFEPELTSE